MRLKVIYEVLGTGWHQWLAMTMSVIKRLQWLWLATLCSGKSRYSIPGIEAGSVAPGRE